MSAVAGGGNSAVRIVNAAFWTIAVRILVVGATVLGCELLLPPTTRVLQ